MLCALEHNAMNVFISYRRAEQNVGIAAWSLGQTLKQRGWTVFMDLEIPPLADWKGILRDAVAQSSIMLVAMGPRWLDQLKQREASREADWVRFEVATALTRSIPIGAVLFGKARVPAEQDLPEDVRRLVDHQAVKISTSSPKDFDRDCSAFVADLEKHYQKLSTTSTREVSKVSNVMEEILRPLPTVQIANTTWRWPGSTTVTFEADGKASYSDTPAGGYWELKGNHLQFDCNRFTMFDVIIDGNSMKGEWYRIGDISDRSETHLEKVG
jgi:hypothetical protein